MKTERPRQLQFPADPAMPDLEVAAQPENVLAACRDQLHDVSGDERAAWTRCKITEAIYQPGRSCRIAYEIETGDSDRPTIVYARWPADGRPHASATRVTTDGGSFDLFRYPRDRRLRQIRAMRRDDWLFEASSAWCRHRDGAGVMALADWRCTPIKYVPESRLVCRLKGRWQPQSGPERWMRAYVRISRINHTAKQAALLRELKHALATAGAPFDVPEVFDSMDEHHLLATEFVRGQTMREAVDENEVGPVLEACERIAGLSKLPLSTASPATIPPAPTPLEMMKDLAVASTELAVHCRTLADWAHTTPPIANRIGLCHGDLHGGQIIEKKGRFVVVDWDRVCIGDPVRDLCNFISDIEFRSYTKGFSDDSAIASRLLAAWKNAGGTVDHASYTWWRTYADTLRAWGLLRHLRPGWPAACAWLLSRAASQ